MSKSTRFITPPAVIQSSMKSYHERSCAPLLDNGGYIKLATGSLTDEVNQPLASMAEKS